MWALRTANWPPLPTNAISWTDDVVPAADRNNRWPSNPRALENLVNNEG